MRILAYHEISDTPSDPVHGVSVTAFRQQMQWLADHGYGAVHLGQGSPRPKTIGIMFDDGYLDTYMHAWPVLQAYGFTATVFLITSVVGDRIRWTPQWEEAGLMTWEQAQEMVEGGIQFGSHSHTHPDLTSLSAQQIDDELEMSRTAIRSRLCIEADLFSYPYSRVNRIVAERVRAAGYRQAFRFSPFFPGTGRRNYGDLPATGIVGHDGLEQFQHKVRGTFPRWLNWRLLQVKALVQRRRLPEC